MGVATLSTRRGPVRISDSALRRTLHINAPTRRLSHDRPGLPPARRGAYADGRIPIPREQPNTVVGCLGRTTLVTYGVWIVLDDQMLCKVSEGVTPPGRIRAIRSALEAHDGRVATWCARPS